MSSWHDARHILCVRLDNLGDVLMTTPAMRALKECAPGRRITLLGSPAGAAAAAWIPEVDDAIAYEAPWMKASAASDAEADKAFVAELQARQFDAAVIFTTYSQSPLPAALMCWLAGIPRRLAYCRENPYQLLTDWQVETESMASQAPRHEVRRMLDLVASVGASTRNERLSFRAGGRENACMRDKLRACGVDASGPILIVHPGATAASRRYPAAHFARVIEVLQTRLDGQIVLTGSASERALCESLLPARNRRVHCLAGELTLGEFAALIADSTVLLSNNSGPVHLAAALGTPVVDLYALTNPQHTPWMVANKVLNHDVPCRNCYKSICPQGHHACLDQLAPDDVIAAVCELWKNADGRVLRTRAHRLPAAGAVANALVNTVAGLAPSLAEPLPEALPGALTSPV